MLETELYHYGVKGMKWGVRKDRLRQAKVRFSGFAKKAGVKLTRLAKDPRVQIGSAVVAGVLAGVFGNMAIANIMATRAFSKLLNYGESQITRHMSDLEADGYIIGEPSTDRYGVKSFTAFGTGDHAGASVRYEQNLRNGSVHYDFVLDGRSMSNGEMLIGDLD